jgi:hypothetical protein
VEVEEAARGTWIMIILSSGLGILQSVSGSLDIYLSARLSDRLRARISTGLSVGVLLGIVLAGIGLLGEIDLLGLALGLHFGIRKLRTLGVHFFGKRFSDEFGIEVDTPISKSGKKGSEIVIIDADWVC